MNDPFTSYETGLKRLLERLGKDHPRYIEALTLQARLADNVLAVRSYGDTPTLKSERMQILQTLNHLAIDTLGTSFNELYLSSLETTPIPQWEPSTEPVRTADVQSKMLAEHIDRLEAISTTGLKLTPEQIGLFSQLLVAAMPQPDNAPLTPAIYAPREDLVRELCDTLEDVTWLALVDGPGKGKTQLAQAVARVSGVKHFWWISLRNQEETTAHLHLERQIAHWLVQLTGDEHFWQLYIGGRVSLPDLTKLISQSVGEDGLLVVDDLPDALDSEWLFRELNSIATVFTADRTKLITTSQRDLPPNFQTDLSRILSVVKPPYFSKDDIFAMLEGAGAPEEMKKDGIISLILGSTSGHPSLVAATVHWLKQRQWGLGMEDWTALISSGPVENVREYERRRMLRLLDERPREFLYRLSLLWTEFDRTLALEVASVSPCIEYPGECLDQLTGPWLDHTAVDRFEVTPLLRNAGQHNLPGEIQKQVHGVVADHYLSQGTVDASQAHTVALHLWAAGDYQRFATFLIQFMIFAKTPAQAKYIVWAAWVISPDMKWPDELSLDLRIMLRAAQVRTCILAGDDATRLNMDLEQLIAGAGPDETHAIAFAYMNTGPFLNEMPAEIAVQRTIKAVRLLRDNPIVPAEVFSRSPEEIIWIPVMRLEEPEQIREFLLEVREMADEERSNLFETDLADETTPRLIDRIWWTEADKPTEQRNWDSVLDLLDEIQEIGALPGALPLQIAEVRARAVVLADYLGKADAAIDILNAVPDPESQSLSFLILYTAGCIMFDAGQYTDALHRLDTAAVTGGDAFSYYRLDAKRRAAIAQSRLGKWDDAKRRCIEVIHFVLQSPDFLYYDRLEMMGELAWIHWATGNKQKACAAMYGFVMGLIASEDATESRFREAFNKAGHSLGWFLSIATTGEPPSLTQYGEPYAPVEAGIFGIRRDRLGSYIPPLGFSKALLLTQLGMLAGALSLSRMAWKIYKVADPFVQQDQYKTMLEYLWVERASLAMRFGDPDEAVNLGLQAVKALAVAKRLRENGIVDVLSHSVNLEDIWDTISNEDRKKAERQLLYTVFGPVFANLLSTDLPQEEWVKRLTAWESTVYAHRTEFTDPDFWDEVVQFFNRLVADRNGQEIREEDTSVPEGEVLLNALLYLATSSQQSTRLVDSLRMQVMALDFLVRSASRANHMLPGVGRFIHRFWVNIADTRGFALNSPQLFRGELLAISPEQGANTGVKVLLSASRAVGISLPKQILTRFRQVEESETH